MSLFKDEGQKAKIHKIYLLISAGLIFSGVIVSLFLDGFGGLRYMTNLSNILASVYLVTSFFLYGKKEIFKSYFSISTIIAILITGLVFNFVIVPLTGYDPVFLSKDFARNYQNTVAHFFSVILVFINYFFFEKKGYFKFTHILAGMIFPLAYWVFFVTIGGIINFYPYFFMDVPEIGWGMTLVWLVILLAAFSVLGFLLLIIDKAMGKKYTTIIP